MEIVTGDIAIECPHCGHELQTERRVSFGLDVVRCASCKKFVKIETFARTTRLKPKRSVERYAEVIEDVEVV